MKTINMRERAHYRSRTQLIKEGWKNSEINEYLPEPELFLYRKYPKQAPVKLWSLDVIAEVEDAMFKAEKQRESVQNGVRRRKR